MFQCYLGPGRLAVLVKWLPNTATTLDRFHCSYACQMCSVPMSVLYVLCVRQFICVLCKCVCMRAIMCVSVCCVYKLAKCHVLTLYTCVCDVWCQHSYLTDC